MDAWTTLGLAPTDDAKIIKKAYAVLLKQNKPDENPSGFAQLHKAYKECINEAKYAAYEKQNNSDDADNNAEHETDIAPQESITQESTTQESIIQENAAQKPIQSEHKNPEKIPPEIFYSADNTQEFAHTSHVIISEPLVPSHAQPVIEDSANTNNSDDVCRGPIINDPIGNEPVRENKVEDKDAEDDDAETQYFNSAKQFLIEKTQSALEKMRTKDDISAWYFLDDGEVLYDLELKSAYSTYLMGQWVDFLGDNKITAKQRKQSLLLLNHHFDWISQELDFGYDYDYEQIAPIFAVLHSPQEQPIKWFVAKHHQGRIIHGNHFAKIAATFLDLVAFVIILSSIASIHFDLKTLMIALPSYFIVMAILEASPMQGSPGKVLFGLKVTNRKGQRLNIFHSLWRQLLFLISTAAFKITLWINMFMSNGNLLHDQLSCTCVIKR